MKAIKNLMDKPCDAYTRWWYKTFMGIENATISTHIKCNIVTSILAIVFILYGAYEMPWFKDWCDDKVDKIISKF